MITRRNFVAGLATLIAAPAIVRVSSLMQLRSTPSRALLLHGGISVYAEGNVDLLEGLSQQMASTVFYGNDGFDPVSFHGLERLKKIMNSPEMLKLQMTVLTPPKRDWFRLSI